MRVSAKFILLEYELELEIRVLEIGGKDSDIVFSLLYFVFIIIPAEVSSPEGARLSLSLQDFFGF
jgi:hypothetical protein